MLTRVSSASLNHALIAIAMLTVAAGSAESTSVTTASAPTSLTYPTDGAINVDTSLPLQWFSIPNAQAYYLYVGSTCGTNDLVNTGEIQQTSYLASGLPRGMTVCARIYTHIDGVWNYSDTSFTTSLTVNFIVPVVAQFIAPTTGATNVDTTLPFQWTAVANVQAYYLYVGSTCGAKDLIDSGEIQQTSYPASSLGSGQTVCARIHTHVAGVWHYSDAPFTTLPVAHFITPMSGALNVDTTIPIQWTAVPNVQAYYLYVGSTCGINDVVDTGEIQQTSYPALGLGAGQTLCARIYTHVGGVWHYSDASFTTSPVLNIIPPTVAHFIAPVTGATNVDTTQSIQWTAVSNAQAYYLYVGSTCGAKDLIDSGEIQQTGYPASSLGVSQSACARIYTHVGSAWNYSDATFTTAPTGYIAPGTPPPAHFIAPANRATNVDTTLPFQWTAVAKAQAYYLYVGSTCGARDLVDSGEIQQTSYPAPGLGGGQTACARIYTHVAGVWNYSDASFTTSPAAHFIVPVTGATNVDTTQPIQWTAILNAQAYHLYVGSTCGAKDLVDSGETQQTSYLASGLGGGQTACARIYTQVGGVRNYSDVSFTTSTAAHFIAPVTGATNVDTTQPIQWTAVSNALAYYLYLGSTPGATDLLNTGEIQATSYVAQGLPAAQTVYARIYTKVGGTWSYTSAIYTTKPVSSGAIFVYPAQGAIHVDLTRSLQWLPVYDAQNYFLSVGTARGGNDVLSTGPLQATSYPMGNLPTDRPLYAYLWTQTSNAWFSSDVTFTMQPSVSPAQIEQPTNGQVGFDAGQVFRWSDLDLAQAYRLQIGTTFGGQDLHDSGVIRVPRRFVTNLPAGQMLYGRVMTELGNQWQSSDFTFEVSGSHVTMPLKIESALWAVDFVRRMANEFNHPYRLTELGDLLVAQYRADSACSDYAAELMAVLNEMNVHVQARALDIYTNAGTLDGHTLLELLNTDTQTWMLLDPTFDIASIRSSDGGWASAEDMQSAALAQDWTATRYAFLGANADLYARNYYIDYPLLFLTTKHQGAPLVPSPPTSPLPYFQEVAPSLSGSRAVYVIGCEGLTQVNAILDGQNTSVSCPGIGTTSTMFWASSIAVPSGSSFKVYKPSRFVF